MLLQALAVGAAVSISPVRFEARHWHEAGQGVKTAAYDLQPARSPSFRPEACPGDVICDRDHQVVPRNIQELFAARSPLAYHICTSEENHYCVGDV